MAGLLYSFKCFCCGFAMCFPGLSGASTASLLGVYGDMLGMFENVFKNPRKGISKLFLTVLSVSAGAIGFYLVFSGVVRSHPKAFIYTGSVIMSAGLFFFIKKSECFQNGFSVIFIPYLILGAIIPFSEKILEHYGSFSLSFSSPFSLILCGIFLSAALILPGISFSYMLTFLGIYDKLMINISEKEYSPVLFLIIGIVCGTLLLSSAISRFMKKHKTKSDFFIIGFIISALINTYI